MKPLVFLIISLLLSSCLKRMKTYDDKGRLIEIRRDINKDSERAFKYVRKTKKYIYDSSSTYVEKTYKSKFVFRNKDMEPDSYVINEKLYNQSHKLILIIKKRRKVPKGRWKDSRWFFWCKRSDIF